MRSDWNDAVLYFYEAESLAAELPDETIKPYTDFALASSYLMQGEDEAASGKLQNIPETAPDILRAHRFYQQGIIAFHTKDYAEAQNATEDPEADLTDSIILDIIRKREQTEWKKTQRESEPAINDY